MKSNAIVHAILRRRLWQALCVLICVVILAAVPARAQEAGAGEGTFVFPYEGFRFDAPQDARILTQHNLSEHTDFLHTLGTDEAAMRAGMQAMGTVAAVFPNAGGQIEITVVPAAGLPTVSGPQMSAADRQALLDAYKAMPRYQEVDFVAQAPDWLRMVFSVKQADLSVFTLRYVTLAHGRQYMLSSVLIGREPEPQDDALLFSMVERISYTGATATPAPTLTPASTPEPDPTAKPKAGQAERVGEGGDLPLTIESLPAWVDAPELTIEGVTEPGAVVTVRMAEKELARGSAKEGAFALKVKLPDESGAYNLRIEVQDKAGRTASATYAVAYQKPKLAITITEPVDPVRRKEGYVRGVTQPGARIDIRSPGLAANVRANEQGEFGFRVKIEKEGEYVYELEAKLTGWEPAEATVRVTREYSYQEALAAFRSALSDINYGKLLADPAHFVGKRAGYRGRVAEIGDADGVPCLLIYTEKVGGEWANPVWALCEELPPCAIGDPILAYVQVTGESMPYTDGKGETAQLPVTRLHFYDL